MSYPQWGGSTLDRKVYSVKILANALEDIDKIYCYIKNEIKSNQAAANLVDKLEEAIFSLELFPHRGAKRKSKKSSKWKYRQLFVKNFTVVYRIDNLNQSVIIVAVKFTPKQNNL